MRFYVCVPLFLFATSLAVLSACGPAYVPREYRWMEEQKAQRAIEDSLRRRLVVDSLVVEDSLRRVHYPEGPIRVLFDPATIVLRDSGGVAAHVEREGEDIRDSYAALFLDAFTTRLAEETESEVRSGTMPSELEGRSALPETGTVFEVDGRTPDYLVWVRSVETNRQCRDVDYAANSRAQCIGVYADMVVWNNQGGWPMAYGKLRGKDGYAFSPNRSTYVGAVSDLAASLAKHAPLPPESRPQPRGWDGFGPPPGSEN